MADETLNTFDDSMTGEIVRTVDWVKRHRNEARNRRRRTPLAPRESNGGGSLVLFELTTVDCDAGTATGTAIIAACTGTLPTGTQDITDDLGCFLTGAELLLIGMRCWCQESDGAYGCAWSIVSMCCADATC